MSSDEWKQDLSEKSCFLAVKRKKNKKTKKTQKIQNH